MARPTLPAHFGAVGTWDADVRNAINDVSDRADGQLPVNTQTGASYTLVGTDAGKVVERNVATANTTIVPPNVFAAGQVVYLHQRGAGQSSVTAGSGLTLRSNAGSLNMAGQYTDAMIRFYSATEAVLTGAIA
jgi:hypothetical protein